MNAIILFIIGIPLMEIYLMIKVGGVIGAFNTIFLIFFTAISGLYCARLAGLNTIRSGVTQLIKNEVPIYEIISGAAIAFAALLLILPGFVTDLIGFLLLIPVTRKFFISSITTKFKNKNNKFNNNENIIEGSVEENQQEKNDKDN